MIVVMRTDATQENVSHLVLALRELGLTPHVSQGVERTVVGVLGPIGPAGVPNALGSLTPDLGAQLEGLTGVESVLAVSNPYKLASREFHPESTLVRISSPAGDVCVGAEAAVMMAGPCTVESEAQLLAAAQAAREGGASVLRGGAYKPSTSPYGFRGL